ncbi:MAG: formamidopyrimidine-DNA glycosylase [Alphaproteobacteria bacterium]|nr:formamidopyrimidine-DNA glycosylase [Alphaproteobacteria bacterium]
MPELPDVTVYVERLRALTQGHRMEGVRLVSPFLLRTVDPPLMAVNGTTVAAIHRLGKRMVFELDDGGEEPLFLVIHLMIAGRLRWRPEGAKRTTPNAVALLDFDDGTLLFTEASKKKRASLHLIRGRDALIDFDRGGMDVFAATPAAFGAILRDERHTLKRSLTDPRYFDGIGNAYSDEILWKAKLSPVRMSDKLTDEEVERLLRACQDVLSEWIDRTRAEVGDGFPDKVTAFRDEMAVHGKFGKPCPECGAKVQRIVYAENETNYCPGCQTEGKLLADRALSTLLKKDWPKTVAELEEMKRTKR